MDRYTYAECTSTLLLGNRTLVMKPLKNPRNGELPVRRFALNRLEKEARWRYYLFLASMSSSAYNIYCSLVHMYESDSKKLATKSDCKGFQFKGLWCLDLDSMLDILKKAKDGSLK